MDDSLKQLLSTDNLESYVANLSFEGGLKLLEQLVELVESGTLPLDRAVISYEKGVSLIKHLRTQLTGAEEKLRVLQPKGL